MTTTNDDADHRLREGDQQLPVPNMSTPIVQLVKDDLSRRMELGIKRYGTPLQARNGRDALRDAYEEALDLACYLRQAIEERNDVVALPAYTYRSKSTTICAIRWDGNNLSEIWDLFHTAGIYGPTEANPDHLLLTTIDGVQVPCPIGHYVIAEPMPDRFYSCDPDVFAKKYEAGVGDVSC